MVSCRFYIFIFQNIKRKKTTIKQILVKVIKSQLHAYLMGNKINVSMTQDLLTTIFEGAKQLYPKENIMFLRGKKTKDTLKITELVIPPLAVHGQGFTNAPVHMLPMDFSIVGTVHSHPSGNLSLSNVDFNHFFGRIMMIVGFPFSNENNIAIYDSKGEKLQLLVSWK